MKYRVGVSGLRRGVGLARMFSVMPDCEVTALCDINAETLDKIGREFPQAKQFTDYSEMLNSGLDIVMVATPIPVHREQTVAAMDAGCHVLQEVTLADSVENCEAIVRSVKAHPKQKFMLAENCCYWAHIMSWAKMWQDGLLGKFLYAEAEYVHDIRSLTRNADGTPTWRASRPPIVYCTHSLGPIIKITGERPVSVCGFHSGGKMEPELKTFLDFEVGIIQTASHGVIKILRGQGFMREPAFHYYSIYGSEGTLETSRPPEALKTNAYLKSIPNIHSMLQIPLDTDAPGAPAVATVGGHGTAEYYMVRDFVDSITNNVQPRQDVFFAWEVTMPGLCAHESAMNGGKPFEIPDLR